MFYVSNSGNDDTADCSESNPCRSYSKILTKEDIYQHAAYMIRDSGGSYSGVQTKYVACDWFFLSLIMNVCFL